MVTLTTFDPYKIPWQARVLELLRKKWDWGNNSYPEILLSGGVGSAKSTLLAHIAVTHCLFNRKALVALCRKALPDLKRTLFQEVLDHLEPMTLKKHYYVNHSNCSIFFPHTGSWIISVTWADKRYKKIRSLKLSGVIIEELTENDDDDFEAFIELKGRLRRRGHVKENFLIAATNPDSPDHWAYRYFIQSQPHSTRYVFYSKPTDNPFLPSGYIEQLRRDLDPVTARRMLEGEWISADGDGVYYCFSDSNIVEKIDLNPTLPIDISWDFNIAIGKPLSVVIGQYDKVSDVFRVLDCVTIETLSTEQMMVELDGRGWLKSSSRVRIFGDATGQARSTASLISDYDIITRYLGKVGVTYEFCVPRSNPPIKERHNRVNAYLKNDNGIHRVLIDKRAQKLIEGLRNTRLKKGAGYVEDDSKDYQHVTTALGYWICYLHNSSRSGQIIARPL